MRFDGPDVEYTTRTVRMPGPGELLVVHLPQGATDATLRAVRDAFRAAPWYREHAVLVVPHGYDVTLESVAVLERMRDEIDRALEAKR